MDGNNERNYEQVKIQYPDGDVWIRRVEGQQEKAEIISDRPGMAECLKMLEKNNPDVINVIADDDAQQVIAIVKSALHIEIVPATGDMSFIVEKPYTGEESCGCAE